MLRHYRLQKQLFAALMLVFAACGAALFAHVGIDLAGDVLLAHDTYDGVDHRSRSEMVAFALTIALGSVLRLLWCALQAGRSGRLCTRMTVDAAFCPGPRRFVAMVVVLTLPALMTMELIDVLSCGSRVDDVTDLLGGSAPLGLGITVSIAILVALAVRHVARLVLKSHRVLVTVIGRLIVLLAREVRRWGRFFGRTILRTSLPFRSILSRRGGKRGPPLLSS